HMGDAARCRELGIAAYLVKPIRQSELLDTICKAFRETSQSEAKAPASEFPPPESVTGRHVLLAEDNLVNQTLAVRLLERRGYRVTVASDGVEALEALKQQRFDVVLMDI